MSRSVDLFISAAEPLDVVAAKVGDLAQVTVESRPDGGWAVRNGETSVSLGENRYIDDGDLPLARYQYVMSGRAPETSRPQDSPEAVLLRRVASDLQQGTGWPVLMVLDLQYKEQAAACAVDSRSPETSVAGATTAGPGVSDRRNGEPR